MTEELQAVNNAWRHRSLRFNAGGVTCTADVEAESALLFETPVVEERDLSYPDEVKMVAATLMVPEKRRWFPAQGRDAESMAQASCTEVDGRRVRLRFLHFFEGEGEVNARLQTSPFSGDGCVMLLASRKILSGESVVMGGAEKRRAEEAKTVERCGNALLADVRARDRWTAVGIEPKIEEFQKRCSDRAEEFKSAVKASLEEHRGDIAWETFLRHYASGVSVDLSFLFCCEPLALPRPPVMGALECEEAVRVIGTRKMLGVSDLEKKMREQLEELKNFKPPDEKIEDYDTTA